MPASLLELQLEALEPPTPDERAIELDIAAPPESLVDRALAGLLRDSATTIEQNGRLPQ